jgi:hypothetical protein
MFYVPGRGFQKPSGAYLVIMRIYGPLARIVTQAGFSMHSAVNEPPGGRGGGSGGCCSTWTAR